MSCDQTLSASRVEIVCPYSRRRAKADDALLVLPLRPGHHLDEVARAHAVRPGQTCIQPVPSACGGRRQNGGDAVDRGRAHHRKTRVRRWSPGHGIRPAEGFRPEAALVFAGDGHLISRWSGSLEAADVPSTMIVGVHRVPDEMLRLQEYSPGFEPGRFRGPREVLRRGECVDGCVGVSGSGCPPNCRRCSVSRRAGSWPSSPLGFGIQTSTARSSARRPAVATKPPGVMPRSLPRTYLVAGTLEPFFRDNATRWATALRDAGGDVAMTERVGSHGDTFWQEELRADGGLGILDGEPPRCPTSGS